MEQARSFGTSCHLLTHLGERNLAKGRKERLTERAIAALLSKPTSTAAARQWGYPTNVAALYGQEPEFPWPFGKPKRPCCMMRQSR